MKNRIKRAANITVILLCIFSMFSCSPNHRFGLSFLAEKEFVELPDGRIIPYYIKANDHYNKRQSKNIHFHGFNQKDINKWYPSLDTITVQELEVKDLKNNFNEFDYTLVSIWFGCKGSLKYELSQFKELVDTLSKVTNDQNKIAYALITVSYEPKRIEYFLKSFDYHYQSYVIPSSKYGYDLQIKEVNFLKELCPECYEKHKYYVQLYSTLLLDSYGEVIKVFDYIEDPTTNTSEIKDYDHELNYLLGLIKE